MKITHGLVLVDPRIKQVVHFCGYPCEITQQIVDGFYEELKHDPTLGFTDTIDDLEIRDATPETVEYFSKIVGEF